MRLLIAGLFFVVVLCGIILYYYNTVTYGKSYPSNSMLSNSREALFKLVQSVNPATSRVFRDSTSSVPEFNVSLSRKNIEYINGVIGRAMTPRDEFRPAGNFISYYDNDYTEDTKTKVLFEEKEYGAKIKIHGVWHPNFSRKKKSYSLKASKDQLINQMRKITFALPEKEFLGGLLEHEISRQYGYMTIPNGIARLRFNGVDQGLYFYEEGLSKELLEKNGYAGCDIIKTIDEWTHQYNHSHYTPFIYNLSARDFESLAEQENGQLLLFEKLMNSTSYGEIREYIDEDKFARHEAMRAVFGTYHCITGDNLALILDNSNGRFFPFFRPEGVLARLETGPSTLQTIDYNLYADYFKDGTVRSENPLFKRLIKDRGFRELRNKYLYKMLADREKIQQVFRQFRDTFQADIENDFSNNFSLPYYRFRSDSQQKDLNHNFNVISRYLNYGRVYATFIQEDAQTVRIEVTPDANSPLALHALEMVGVDPETPVKLKCLQDDTSLSTTVSELPAVLAEWSIMAELDDRYEPVVTMHEFVLRFESPVSITDVKTGFVNRTTGKAVKDSNCFTRLVVRPDKFNLNPEVSMAHLNAAGLRNFSLTDRVLTVHAGRSEVVDDIILPHGLVLVLEKGVEIRLAADKSLLVQAGLTVQGTSDQPVVIGCRDNVSFGVFAAVGNGMTRVHIKGLDLSGGSEDWINGRYLSGGLSLYNHSTVSLLDSRIRNNAADDGLNVKHASVMLSGNEFSANAADQVDLDVTVGVVMNNKFAAISKGEEVSTLTSDMNGDGLDFSGSRVLVKGNVFTGFSDKGISVGENSEVLVVENIFTANRSAMTVKDQSRAYLGANQIDRETHIFSVEAYQKKPHFAPPSLYFLDGELPAKPYQFSADTTTFIQNSANAVEVGAVSTWSDIPSLFDELKKIEWISK
ncbi:right-handed parallel beta-helix repeat-containing protein [Akkermansiaceae bacterium]|nr:right-handed parallel beta-helix repeat-containing protein [Akkermansiaceae bacterium]